MHDGHNNPETDSFFTNRSRSLTQTHQTRPLQLVGGMALLDLDELEEARKVVERSELEVRRTPCILVRGDQACNILPELNHVKGWNRCQALEKIYMGFFTLASFCWRVYFKLENLQSTGSFKIRGVANQVGVHLEENSSFLSIKFPAKTNKLTKIGREFSDCSLVWESQSRTGRRTAVGYDECWKLRKVCPNILLPFLWRSYSHFWTSN
jgi:hypothetical protein